jgi:hypothetical protein
MKKLSLSSVHYLEAMQTFYVKKEFPDLRFGQFIMNAYFQDETYPDLFYCEDKDVQKYLEIT